MERLVRIRNYFNSGITKNPSFRINQLEILKKAIIEFLPQIENALKKIQTKFISLQSTEMKIQPLKFIADENTNPAK